MSFNINNSTLSTGISILVAIAVLIAGLFQWWDITYNGKMVTKLWVKILFIVLIVMLVISLALILIHKK
jgi:hypothetical protein